MSIKRYEMDHKGLPFEDVKGSFVLHEDHAEEVARLNEQVRALTAENLTSRNAVKTFCDVVGDSTHAICEEVGDDGVRVILAAMKATGNMPATDAILNEVRAQGAIDARNAMVAAGDGDDIYAIVTDVAARIRKGEQP